MDKIDYKRIFHHFEGIYICNILYLNNIIFKYDIITTTYN